MAERRLSSAASAAASARLSALRLRPLPPPAQTGWFIQDAAEAVTQPFYAALDADLRLCWTDNLEHAEQFGSKAEAERFVLDRMTTEARVIGHA